MLRYLSPAGSDSACCMHLTRIPKIKEWMCTCVRERKKVRERERERERKGGREREREGGR